jgi:hypothetical protein
MCLLRESHKRGRKADHHDVTLVVSLCFPSSALLSIMTTAHSPHSSECLPIKATHPCTRLPTTLPTPFPRHPAPEDSSDQSRSCSSSPLGQLRSCPSSPSSAPGASHLAFVYRSLSRKYHSPRTRSSLVRAPTLPLQTLTAAVTVSPKPQP